MKKHVNPWIQIKCWSCEDSVWVRHTRWWPYTDGKRHGTCAACIAIAILKSLTAQILPPQKGS